MLENYHHICDCVLLIFQSRR